MDRPTLYVILGSHACRTGMLLMGHKGIEYRPVELRTGTHPLALRVRGFAGNRGPLREVDGKRPFMLAGADSMGTVPALKLGGRQVKTNRAIARFLDELQPDPPLFPADPQRRAAVEEAERWGDEQLQMVARRLALAGADPRDAGEGRLGPLLYRNAVVRGTGVWFFRRFVFDAGGDCEARLRAELPALLDRIDAWIAAGVLNGEQLNAADYVIAPSLALLTYVPALRPELQSRPLMALVDRVLPA